MKKKAQPDGWELLQHALFLQEAAEWVLEQCDQKTPDRQRKESKKVLQEANQLVKDLRADARKALSKKVKGPRPGRGEKGR